MSVQIDKIIASQQTLAGKEAEWARFLSLSRGSKPMNSPANFTFLIGVLEKESKLVSPKSLHEGDAGKDSTVPGPRGEAGVSPDVDEIVSKVVSQISSRLA
jgi:hypothetical protein